MHSKYRIGSLGNSANTDSIRQAKGEPGRAPIPTPTLETNKHNWVKTINLVAFESLKKILRKIADRK